MATIDSLGTSISTQSNDTLYERIRLIRNNRRRRPTKKLRAKSAPAKTRRKPNARAPKPQDMFALVNKMTTQQKAALAAKLTGKK